MGNYKEGHLDIILKENTPMEIILLMMDLANYNDDIFSPEKKTREERIARLKYKNQDELFKSEYLDWVHLDIIFEILGIDNKFDWYTYEEYEAYILLNESGLENNLKNLEEFYYDVLDSDKKYHKVIEHILQHKFRKIKFHFSICSKYYDNELDKIFEFLKSYIEETEECLGEIHDEDGYLGKEYYYNGRKNKKEKIEIVEIQDIINLFDKLKEQNGNQWVIIETPTGSASLQLKNALVYEGCCGEIVLDSE